MSSAPILNRDELKRAVADARARGESIILTNGCFDLFHVGHIRYLEGAKALGGFVVTAINSDRQVRGLKGDGRPFMPEIERAGLHFRLLHRDVHRRAPPDTEASVLRRGGSGQPMGAARSTGPRTLQARTGFTWPTELHLPGYRPVTRPHAKQIREAARLMLDAGWT